MPKSKLQRYCMKQTFDSKHFLNPVILPSETANNISNYIKASNLKIKDLQNLFGFEQPQAIYNWRSGKDLPSIDNRVKLAHFLNTTVDTLIAVDLRENEAVYDVPDEFQIR